MTACPSNILEPQVTIPIFVKAPAEQLAFGFDWSEILQALDTTIYNSYWVLPSTTLDDISNAAILLSDGVTVNYNTPPLHPRYASGGTYIIGPTDNITAIILVGGSEDTMYTIQNVVMMVSGLIFVRQFKISCQGHTNP